MEGIAGLLSSSTVISKNGSKVDLASHFNGKTVGLYFSAHWCPPCRGFTPVLKEFYNQYHETKNFEIIFISFDRDKESFDSYYNEMPWLALAYEEKDKNVQLREKFNIQGIPTLVLMNGDNGKVYNYDAVECMQNESSEKFPWKE